MSAFEVDHIRILRNKCTNKLYDRNNFYIYYSILILSLNQLNITYAHYLHNKVMWWFYVSKYPIILSNIYLEIIYNF